MTVETIINSAQRYLSISKTYLYSLTYLPIFLYMTYQANLLHVKSLRKIFCQLTFSLISSNILFRLSENSILIPNINSSNIDCVYWYIQVS